MSQVGDFPVGPYDRIPASLTNQALWHQIDQMKAEIVALNEQMVFLRKEIEDRESRIQDTLLQLHGQLAFSFDDRDIRG